MEFMPNELLDHVCAYVAYSNSGEDAQDATSLASCCRVSRRFYAAAQPLLYSSIRLELMTGEPNLLLKALKANVHLAGAVRTLFIQCGAPCSTPMQHINQLRDFLAQALPLFTNLTNFRSDHRITTVKLVETTLYHDSGYTMGIPKNLENIQTLELFAADYIYKYNYILRLPRLKRVVLYSMKIVDLEGDDRAYPNDWGWVSHTVKELEIHQGFRSWNAAPYRLWSNSLQALARSLPSLSYLRLYHHECTLYPRQSRQLLDFFTPQLRSTLRKLVIEDGRIDAHHPQLGYNYLTDDSLTVLDEIRDSHLDYLSIDLHTLCSSVDYSDTVQAINTSSLPQSLRRLHVRHVEINDVSSKGDISALLERDIELVGSELLRKCPKLAKIDLEVRLLRKPDYDTIEKYRSVFASMGVLFDVRVHECPAQRRSSILYSRH